MTPTKISMINIINQTKLLLFTIAYTSMLLYFINGMAVSWIPISPISSSIEAKFHRLSIAFPQSWAFFTRDPSLPMLAVYHRDKGKNKWRNITEPLAQSKYWFGFKRDVRRNSIIGGRLAYGMNDNSWQDCEKEIITCISSMKPITTLERLENANDICGNVAVVREYVIPWSWPKDANIIMPSKILLFDISCS